jgi:hypothetical protein
MVRNSGPTHEVLLELLWLFGLVEAAPAQEIVTLSTRPEVPAISVRSLHTAMRPALQISIR